MKKISILLSLFVVVTSCYNGGEQQNVTTQKPSNEQQYKDHSNAVDGTIAVLVSEELGAQLENMVATKSSISTVLDSETLLAAGITKIERMFPYAGKFEARTREAGLHLWYNVTFDESVPNTRVAGGFFELDGVEKVEAKCKPVGNNEMPTLFTADAPAVSRAADSEEFPFNDPDLLNNRQWHYKNNANEKGFVKGMDVNVNPVWRDGITGNPAVIVSVVDGGIDVDHEDLAANMYVNSAELNGEPGVDDDGNGYKDDIYGYNFVSSKGEITAHHHGTHVAGTIAAVNNNGVGVAGIAGGNGSPDSGVRIMSCQMLEVDASGNDASGAENAAALAIKYGADHGAVISQNSWSYGTPGLFSYDRDAIDYFVEYAGLDEDGNQVGPLKGGIVLFAAGNDSATYCNPGEYESAYAVTAISPDGAMAPYSNYGEWADIAAPGGEKVRWEAYIGGVYSTIIQDTEIGGQVASYGSYTGTSMACPHVSGIVALYISKMYEAGKHIGLTPDMVMDRLLNTTRSLSESEPKYYPLMGRGLVDAARFVGVATATTPATVADLKVAQTLYTSLQMEWGVAENAKGYTIFCSETSLDGVDFDALPDDVRSIDVNKFADADGKMRSWITGLTPSTDYYIAIRSWDYADNVSEVSSEVTVTTVANKAPEFYKDGVLVDGCDELEVTPEGQIKVSYKIVDPEGGNFEYDITSASKAESAPIYNSTTQILTLYIVGSKAPEGIYEAKVTASDDFGGSTDMIIRYTIAPNGIPEVVAPIEDLVISEVGANRTIDLSKVFTDDNSELTYSVTSSESGVADISIVDDATLSITTKAHGTSIVTVTATDDLGASASEEFSVICSNANGVYSVAIYPNPVKTIMNVHSDAAAIDKVVVYNSRGAKVLSSSKLKPSCEIDLSALTVGLYSVDVVIGGKSYIKKVTKL